MTDLTSTLMFLGIGVVVIMLIAIFRGVFSDGPLEIERLRRKGYGIGPMFKGQLNNASAGATGEVKKGIEIVVNGPEVESVRQTSTLTGEFER